MIARPSFLWILARLWEEVTGAQQRREIRELIAKTNALLARIAREEAEQRARDLPPWERRGSSACNHGMLTCPICHGWGPKPGNGGA